MNLLLEKAQMAVLDGKCFGNYGEGYIRLCYTLNHVDKIEKALKRIKNINH